MKKNQGKPLAAQLLLVIGIFALSITTIALSHTYGVTEASLVVDISPETVNAFFEKNAPITFINYDRTLANQPAANQSKILIAVVSIDYTLGVSKSSAREVTQLDYQFKQANSEVLA